jgi:hypothetical protein
MTTRIINQYIRFEGGATKILKQSGARFLFGLTVFLLVATLLFVLPAAVFAEGDESGGSESVNPAPAESGSPGADSGDNTGAGDFGSVEPEPAGAVIDNETFPTPEVTGEADPIEPQAAESSNSTAPDAEGDDGDQTGSQEPEPAINAESGNSELPATEAQTDFPQDSTDEDIGGSEEQSQSGTRYFQVAEVSMSPLLNPGATIEIVSENYSEGDMVVAQTSDGKYVVKMLVGDQLVPLGAGVSYAVAEVTILGAASPSGMTAAELTIGGLVFGTVLGETHPITPVIPTGSGIDGNPYLIASLNNLYWITAPGTVDALTQADRWAAHYLQTEDIDADATKTWDDDKGWTPIGTNTNKFTGVYDGDDHTISNLVIYRTGTGNDNVGLFGSIGPAAVVKNLGLLGVSVNGNMNVGALAGVLSEAEVSNCYASGAVTGFMNVGGLVGNSYKGKVEQSYFANTKEAFLGQSTVNASYSGGGLVGMNQGVIKDSYVSGVNISAGGDTGGLVGYNYKSASDNGGTNQGEVYRSYYVGGSVTGPILTLGALIGTNDCATIITDSFAFGYKSGTDELDKLVGSTKGTGTPVITRSYLKTQKELKQIDTFTAENSTWSIAALSSFNNSDPDAFTWYIDEDSAYPVLWWQVEVGGGGNGGEGGNGGSEGGGNDSGTGFDYSGPFTSITPPGPGAGSGSGLTSIPGQAANAVITPAFITGGSPSDLGNAVSAYNQARQNYEANKGSMSVVERAVAETELALANAAIIALELSLTAQNGAEVNLTALVSAYQAAQAALNSNRGQLTAAQVSEAQALLNAIASVIARFTS